MQVMGGIAYTNVFPIERIYRDVRLASIWTGTSEVMSMITAHEWYREYLTQKAQQSPRNYELDAEEAHEEEKIYDDECDMEEGMVKNKKHECAMAGLLIGLGVLCASRGRMGLA